MDSTIVNIERNDDSHEMRSLSIDFNVCEKGESVISKCDSIECESENRHIADSEMTAFRCNSDRLNINSVNMNNVNNNVKCTNGHDEVIRICYWNIQGLNDMCLNDEKCGSYLKSQDILLISETWV